MKTALKAIIIFLLTGYSFLLGIESQVPLPTTDFSLNFMNFPQAWTVSKGKNVKVGVVYNVAEKQTDWTKLVSKTAPEAEVKRIDYKEFLDVTPAVSGVHILLLMEKVEEKDYEGVIKSVESLTGKGVTVIIPAFYGPMRETIRYVEWHKFVVDVSGKGAIIVGVYGRQYQLGALYLWESEPVDVFVVHDGIDGEMYFDYYTTLKRDIDAKAYYVAGAAALLKSKNPELTPAQVRQLFKDRARKVYWGYTVETGEKGKKIRRVWPYTSRELLEDAYKKMDKEKIELKEIYTGHCLDAGLLLGLPKMGSGEWSRLVLRSDEAKKKATGKGVTVAILDHLFNKENPVFKDRIVNPGSVLEGEPVFSGNGHGTWMAQDLVNAAPDVKIMPVRICGNGHYGEADLYIKGIEYAVNNGAKIISLSHQPVPENRQKDLDDAIEKAVSKGVTFVYIHYAGKRKDVVVPGPIEFALYDEGMEMSYIIGTNFDDNSQFPFTWGLSPTAPMVSGVIALMLEINPSLKPAEIHEILLKSANKTADGYPLLDAVKAVSEASGLLKDK